MYKGTYGHSKVLTISPWHDNLYLRGTSQARGTPDPVAQNDLDALSMTRRYMHKKDVSDMHTEEARSISRC